ncbi:Txe/YoeB family addiction module toxin [Halotia wernerae UHCC 0503]|nr:Txe/YoeB family addiction module toxin [Halotia wernerae UHCC 0503]
MTRKLAWTDEAWNDYLYWQRQDKKTLKRINKLIEATIRLPFEGIGKPELLRENLVQHGVNKQTIKNGKKVDNTSLLTFDF